VHAMMTDEGAKKRTRMVVSRLKEGRIAEEERRREEEKVEERKRDKAKIIAAFLSDRIWQADMYAIDPLTHRRLLEFLRTVDRVTPQPK